MARRRVAVLFAAVLLGGCTDADWDHALTYAGMGSDRAPNPAAEQPSVTTQPAPPPDSWCVDVAKVAQQEAAGEGFDQATQRHRAEVAFQQCAQKSGSTSY